MMRIILKKYDKTYDKNCDEKYDDNYNKNYDENKDETYDEIYDQNYDKTYDENYDEIYDENHDENQDENYDENYNNKSYGNYYEYGHDTVMSKYHKLDTKKYPNIFGCHIMYRMNIQIYLDATYLPNKYPNIFIFWKQSAPEYSLSL